MSRPFRLVSALVAPVLAIALVLPTSAGALERARPGNGPPGRSEPKELPALSPAPGDALTRALEAGRLSEAVYALERARTVYGLREVRERYGRVARPEPRGVTLILRDLAVRVRELGDADRKAAMRVLARPTDGGGDPYGSGYLAPEATPQCSANACYHWVTSTDDAPDLTDADVNGVPDWVDTLATVTEQTWATEVTTYGYRAPKSDSTSANAGPDGRIDLYVADVGANGLYGYCATDDPNAFDPNYPYWDASAFCVVDDDFSIAQFPFGASGLAALQVSVAHEFFHAVQFAYDLADDAWFMEGTSTWMEDEVFDAVDDNLQYLSRSQLSQPWVPLDLSDTSTLHVYGSWIWFRFLDEYLADPTVIRDAWALADGSALGPDQYSLLALENAIGMRGLFFRWLYADFGLWNAYPADAYEEGIDYPAPAFAAKHRVTARRDLVAAGFQLDHLTTTFVSIKPGRGVGARSKLLLMVDGPRYRTGPEASAIVVFRNGKVRWFTFALSTMGDGTLKVPFGKGKVSRVVLILTNASTRTRCWVDPSWTYSCAGAPKDDGVRYGYAARLTG
ncbi:MAG TPA: MXAN_6640 family putative metalloprotease [Actinomycetota bacterium]|nr:MXAN_6640 family putative metalloprotease [Actinomycetota bacterium]